MLVGRETAFYFLLVFLWYDYKSEKEEAWALSSMSNIFTLNVARLEINPQKLKILNFLNKNNLN